MIEEQLEFTSGTRHQFLVPLQQLDPDEVRRATAGRARETWVWQPLGWCRVRLGLYTPGEPRAAVAAPRLALAAVEGLVLGGLLLGEERVWKLWCELDQYAALPHPVLSVTVGW